MIDIYWHSSLCAIHSVTNQLKMTTYVHEKIRFVALGSKTVGKSAFGIRLLENGDFFRKDEKWYKIEHHFCEFIAK
jgi:hypothetical protein